MTEFWLDKAMHEFTQEEWESLCDGCARCCLIKLEDEDTQEVHDTAMVCDLLDTSSCRCTAYDQRHHLVPDCVVLTEERARSFTWLPDSCAYKLVANGRDLPEWHHLRSREPDAVHKAGASVRGRVIHYGEVHPDDHESMILTWVN